MFTTLSIEQVLSYQPLSKAQFNGYMPPKLTFHTITHIHHQHLVHCTSPLLSATEQGKLKLLPTLLVYESSGSTVNLGMMLDIDEE